MKRYRVTLEGHTFDVKVLDDPRQERVQVEVDGETFVVGVEAVPVTVERTAGIREGARLDREDRAGVGSRAKPGVPSCTARAA